MTAMRVGIDVGGTKVDAVALSADGAIVARHRMSVTRGTEGVIASVVAAAEQVCAAADVAVADVASVGVGIPGAVCGGVVEHALNLDVERMDLGTELRGRWGVPVAIENDVNVAAL